MAAKDWDEYSGKQVLLSSFLERSAAGSGAGKEAESGASRSAAMGVKEEVVVEWRESRI